MTPIVHPGFKPQPAFFSPSFLCFHYKITCSSITMHAAMSLHKKMNVHNIINNSAF